MGAVVIEAGVVVLVVLVVLVVVVVVVVVGLGLPSYTQQREAFNGGIYRCGHGKQHRANAV